VAVSLDGFLAREDGTVDWLSNYTEPLATPCDSARLLQKVKNTSLSIKMYLAGVFKLVLSGKREF